MPIEGGGNGELNCKINKIINNNNFNRKKNE